MAYNTKGVLLSMREMERCAEFAMKSAETQQAIEFGQKTTEERRVVEIARDTMIGKMAEVAFQKIMLRDYQIQVPLDFAIYPRGRWDEDDATINGWRIDVKGTRRGGRWMLIEWNKLKFRQQDHNLSHIYSMFSVDWDRDSDRPTGYVLFEGVASLSKLKVGCETTRVFTRGELIPGTNMRLQADNFGIRFTDLTKDLDGVVSFITNNAPPTWLTEKYINPYGELARKQAL